MKERLNQIYVLAHIVAEHLHQVAARKFTNLGHWIFHTTTFQEGAGSIQFHCDVDDADGVIRCRERDDYGQPIYREVTFRIENRWPLTGDRRPGGLIMLGLHTQAQLAGLNPVTTHWNTPTARRIRVAPLNIRHTADPMLYATERRPMVRPHIRPTRLSRAVIARV